MNPEMILKECTLPAMPHVAARILEITSDPNARVEDIQRVISSDQALASRVLMLANSAFYGMRRNVDTISDAIFVLGFEAVKKISIAVATRELYQVHGLIEQKLWEHTLGVSIAAGLICSKQSLHEIPVEESIVAGLLHDIGKAVMNQSQPERYAMVVETVYGERIPFYKVEEGFFGFTHQEVGELLFKEWGFTPDLIEVAGKHHKRHEIDAGGNAGGLCDIVRLADCICLRLGVGYRGPMPELCPDDTVRMEMLGIGIDEAEEIIGGFKEKYISEKLSFMS